MSTYVFDASAMLAYIYDEPGADRVEAILKDKDAVVYLNAATLGEVFYDIMQEEGKEAALEALARIRNIGVKIVPLDETLALSTAALKGSSGIPYVDGMAAATALEYKATLVAADPDFERLEERIKIEWIGREA
jgi:predicted nucleic acid-binding protein